MRSLCRIFNFEDNYFIRDVAQVEEMMKALDDNEVNFPEFKAEPGKKVKPTKLAVSIVTMVTHNKSICNILL